MRGGGPNARKQRRGLVVANRRDSAAEIGLVQKDAIDHCEHNKEDQLKRKHPGHLTQPEESKIIRIAVVRLVAEYDEGDATEEAHRANSDYDRG
jgi:hypothetical protein